MATTIIPNNAVDAFQASYARIQRDFLAGRITPIHRAELLAEARDAGLLPTETTEEGNG